MDILNTSTENERKIIQRTKPWGSSKGIQVTSSSMPANPAFRMEGSKLPVNLPKLVQQTPRLVVKKPWLVATKKEGQNNRRHLLRPENDPIFRTGWPQKKNVGQNNRWHSEIHPIFRTTIWTSHGLAKNMEIYGNIYSSGKDTWPYGPAFDMAPVCTSQESNKSISYLCSDYLYHVLP